MPNYRINKQTGNPDTLIAGGTVFADTPIGTIISSGRAYDNPPDGYFFCDGRALSRTTYADLFAAIGTSFGSGDGSTTFNIPELRGEFLRGAGTNQHSGQGNGAAPGVHQDGTKLPNYEINVSDGLLVYGRGHTNTPFSNQDYGNVQASDLLYLDKSSAGPIGSNHIVEFTTRPTNTSVNYFIKATNVPVPADFMSAVDDAVEVAMNPTVVSNALTLASGVTSDFDGNTVTKIGKLCLLDIMLYNSDNPFVTGQTLGTLAANIRPSKRTYLPIIVATRFSDFIPGFLDIGTDGTVKFIVQGIPISEHFGEIYIRGVSYVSAN